MDSVNRRNVWNQHECVSETLQTLVDPCTRVCVRAKVGGQVGGCAHNCSLGLHVITKHLLTPHACKQLSAAHLPLHGSSRHCTHSCCVAPLANEAMPPDWGIQGQRMGGRGALVCLHNGNHSSTATLSGKWQGHPTFVTNTDAAYVLVAVCCICQNA